MKVAWIVILSLVCLTGYEHATDAYSPVYVETQDGMEEAEKVTSLSGRPELSPSQYSGYFSVDSNVDRELFYHFAESEDSSTKPLVLWIRRGPGGSSLETRAMEALGLRVNKDGKSLWRNTKTWNNVANVIFLDFPVEVGFSNSDWSLNYAAGDILTADNAYTFLVSWLERFPEYKTTDFYIIGESYAWLCVPQLAGLILKDYEISNQTIVNLKGITVGNAYCKIRREKPYLICKST